MIIDTSHLASMVGLNNWYDERLLNLAKIPFSTKYIPHYSEHVIRAIASLKGRTGKCLVLDLDNTIWGGVIGDDGINSIKIGQGSPEGEAFIDFQKTIKSLKERGIIITICSKNDEKNAIEVFQNHPEMILKEGDITLFLANWNDKASNIKLIAKTLNIGLDSLVFVDDNPAEREQVRQELPEVNVIEMPADPAFYSRVLLASGAFEAISVSSDDRNKSEQYKSRQKAIKLEQSSENYEDYLKSLEMKCAIKPFDQINRLRITQLINKTNQFNLTTQRYTEAEVACFEQDDKVLTLQARLKDKFGDHGLVALMVAKMFQDKLTIDTFLMSCRVFKRDLEYLMMNELMALAVANNIDLVYGEYKETAKNHIVEKLYQDMGYEAAGEKWVISAKDYQEKKNFIEIMSD